MKQELLKLNKQLRTRVLKQYSKLPETDKLKIMLHLPDNGAVRYAFQSWKLALEHMGIPIRLLPFYPENLESELNQSKPNVFITIAHNNNLSALNSAIMNKYIKQTGMLTGLFRDASFNPDKDDAGFPYDFWLSLHLSPPKEEFGKEVISVPLACNPVIHYMREINDYNGWFFVGTRSNMKAKETDTYLTQIFKKYPGILAGVRWPDEYKCKIIPIEDVPFYYSGAKINLNYHRSFMFREMWGLNERAHIIPACGGFQLTDNPLAMKLLYQDHEMAIANSPEEYLEMYEYFNNNPDERYPYIRSGMKKAYQKYTLFHSLIPLYDYLMEKIN